MKVAIVSFSILSLSLTDSLIAMPETSDCPKLSLQDLQNIHNDKEVHVQGHTWYLKSTYKTRHTALGSNLPLMLMPATVEAAKSIEFDKQISERECQYKIDLVDQKSTGYLLFSKVGE